MSAMACLGQKEVLAALGALSQETRLQIFRLLVQAGPQGRAAGAIADALGVLPATLSFHLAALTNVGLIDQKRERRSLIYSVNYDRMNGVIRFLAETCCDSSTGTWPPRPPEAEGSARVGRTMD
jgi:DNA-binding transcriptional ArsR family regulator